MNPTDKISDDDLVRSEYRALGRLFSVWFSGTITHNALTLARTKLPKFREAVVASIGSGAPQYIPQELATFEYHVIYPCLKRIKPTPKTVSECEVRNRLQNEKLEYELTPSVRFCRPYPVPASMVNQVAAWFSRKGGESPANATRLVVAKRLGIARHAKGDQKETVRRYVSSPNRESTSFEHALLMSVLLDLASDSSGKYTTIRNEVLKRLARSSFPLYCYYYLAWFAHDVPNHIHCGLPADAEVRKLCDHIKSIDENRVDSNELESFTRVISR